MEERKRTLLAVIISCIILLAVGYSFGLNFFSDHPQIVVADPNITADIPGDPVASGDRGGLPVEVTPKTVQSVIATMSRFRSYSRTISIRYQWETESGGITAGVMVDGGWSRCDATLASGIVERSIAGDGTLWYWYDDGPQYLKAVADLHTEDLTQHIPTYEDILELNTAQITGAGYEEKDGIPSIYVEANGQLPGYVERYWVSVDNGLLIAAETEKDGIVVYAMSSSDMISPLIQADSAFTLPDGTVLHQLQS